MVAASCETAPSRNSAPSSSRNKPVRLIEENGLGPKEPFACSSEKVALRINRLM